MTSQNVQVVSLRVLGTCAPPRRREAAVPVPVRAARATSGFTLVELLVVMVIIGVTLGLTALNVLPDRQGVLRGEAERIALLLQLARDEAIVRNRQVAFEADPGGYRFMVRDERQWQSVTRDDLLRERAFKHGPLLLSVEPASIAAPAAAADGATVAPLRIVFGREPVDKPFVLTLAEGGRQVAIRADGIGHFSVE